MSQVAIYLLFIFAFTSACEQRKGKLLPARDSTHKGVENHEAPQEAKAGKSSLSAKSLPEELMGPDDLDERADNQTEITDIDKVKQDALDRIKNSPAKQRGGSPELQLKAENLFLQGQALASSGKTKEGQELYLLACQLGNAHGCHKFGWFEAKSGNQANARQFYKLACDNGLNKSCNNLGVQFERERDWDEALNSYARACLSKHQISCENLKRLRIERLKLR